MLQAMPGLRDDDAAGRAAAAPSWALSRSALRPPQRRVAHRRSTEGPERELIFRQEPSRAFKRCRITDGGGLGVTLAGEWFTHLLYHFRLAYNAYNPVTTVIGPSPAPNARRSSAPATSPDRPVRVKPGEKSAPIKPLARSSRPQRWRAAVAELVRLQTEYAAWLEAMPEALKASAAAEALEAILDLDLDELSAVEPPRGFGRD